MTETHPMSPARHGGTLTELARHGYHVRPVAIATLAVGMYIHITNLFIGQELVVERIVTPVFDMLLAVPITYVGIVVWPAMSRFEHPNRLHRASYIAMSAYFTSSIPFHLQTYVTRSTDLLLRFPWWYSAVILPVMVGLVLFVWRLRLRE